MRIKIDSHDYEFKKNHAERFLLDGNKAKVTIMFRGREVTHPDLGRKLLDRVMNDLMEISTVEQGPLLEGRNMTMILIPNKAAVKARGGSESKEKSGKRAFREVKEKEGPLKAPIANSIEKEIGSDAKSEEAPSESIDE